MRIACSLVRHQPGIPTKHLSSYPCSKMPTPAIFLVSQIPNLIVSPIPCSEGISATARSLATIILMYVSPDKAAVWPQMCEESYQKKCQISFSKHPINETVKSCHKPVRKKCDGKGPKTCRKVYESHCKSKYDER